MKEALFGLAGVLIGVAIPWVQAIWMNHSDLKRRARYLAIRVVCVLDMYVESCLSVAHDDGLLHGQRTKDGCLEPQVPAVGAPVYPSDVDWKSIDHDLMYELLSFPSRVVAGDNAIGFAWDISFPPDYDEFFEERGYRYSEFGLQANELAEKLAQKYEVPRKEYTGWNPIIELQKVLDSIETTRQRRQKA